MDGMDDDATILVLSHLRYDFVFQRPQQVVSRLARNHRILFVEEPVRTGRTTTAAGLAARRERAGAATADTAGGAGISRRPGADTARVAAGDLRHAGPPIVWLYTPMALPLVAEIDARSIRLRLHG